MGGAGGKAADAAGPAKGEMEMTGRRATLKWMYACYLDFVFKRWHALYTGGMRCRSGSLVNIIYCQAKQIVGPSKLSGQPN